MTVLHKTLALKATAPGSDRVFEATVAETWPEDASRSKADKQGDIFAVGGADEDEGRVVDLFYQHDYAPTSEIGVGILHPQASRSVVPIRGQLVEGKPIADAVWESMHLPKGHPDSIHELSVGYSFDKNDAYVRDDGVRVIKRFHILEISLVHKGAQRTAITCTGSGCKTDSCKCAAPPLERDAEWKARLATQYQNDDDVLEALGLPSRRSIAAKAAADAALRARDDLASRSLVLEAAGPSTVFIDARMRPFDPVEAERDADRLGKESFAVVVREKERQRDADRRDAEDAAALEELRQTWPVYTRGGN